MKLIIGNKNYSSWSFRVWLTMRVHGLDFQEELRPFDVANDYADFFEFAPHGKVPVLVDEGTTVWETLSILEYLAERYPDKALWPASREARAHARSVANEMHAGFMALRAACPMNMRRAVAPLAVDERVRKDVRRVEALFDDCLTRYGGPYLLGERFTIADGMFAPVVNRLQIYALSEHVAVERYREALQALEAWQAWAQASAAEPWVVDVDEV